MLPPSPLPSPLLRSVNTVFQRNVGLPELHCSSLSSAWPRCAPAAPSPLPEPLHSTPLSLTPPHHQPPMPASLLLLVSPLSTSSSSSSFFFPLPLFSLPVLVPHHLSLFSLSLSPFSSLPHCPPSPLFFFLSPLQLAPFTLQSFHSIVVNCVPFPSFFFMCGSLHGLIGTSQSKLTGFGPKNLQQQ